MLGESSSDSKHGNMIRMRRGCCQEMGDACKRRDVEYNCEWIPISIPRRDSRHHSRIIGFSSRGSDYPT